MGKEERKTVLYLENRSQRYFLTRRSEDSPIKDSETQVTSRLSPFPHWKFTVVSEINNQFYRFFTTNRNFSYDKH